jgi:hypothetical protein
VFAKIHNVKERNRTAVYIIAPREETRAMYNPRASLRASREKFPATGFVL